MSEVNKQKMRSGRFFIGGILVLIVTAGAYFFLSASRTEETKADANNRVKEAANGVRVHVAPVSPSSPERILTVPGEVRPYATVTMYAKVSGYLSKIAVDKGDYVKEGQFIAHIESPETDRTYDAALATAKNKRSIATRDSILLKQGLLSPQDAEQARSDAETAEQTVASLMEQRNYETLRAPFSGRVSARFADPGALVQSATGSQTSALPLVTISQEDRLRIYIYLDQKDAGFVSEGDSVNIRLLERPDVNIPARITRYSGELDPKSRTLLAEIDLDNSKNVILPGSFVQVSLKIKAHPLLTVPSEALIIKGKDYYAATVDDSGILHFKQIKIADNDGKVCQVIMGLDPTDRVALSLGDAFKDGDRVQVEKPAGAK